MIMMIIVTYRSQYLQIRKWQAFPFMQPNIFTTLIKASIRHNPATNILLPLLFSLAQQPNVGQGRHDFKVSMSHTVARTHTHTHTQSVGPLRTDDRPDVEIDA